MIKMRIKPILILLLILKYLQRMMATDACNGRCSQFEYVYCNPGTGVCDDCSIYCSSDFIFYDKEICSLNCMKQTVTIDACGNRCIPSSDAYCNAVTGLCESCSIYCAIGELFYNATICNDLCPDRLPSSTMEPLLTTEDNSVGTQTGDIVTSIHKSSTGNIGPGFIVATTRPNNTERNATLYIGLFAGIGLCVVFLLVIIGLFYYNYRLRHNNRPQGSTGTRQEMAYEGPSRMVTGHETRPLTNSESRLVSLV